MLDDIIKINLMSPYDFSLGNGSPSRIFFVYGSYNHNFGNLDRDKVFCSYTIVE